MTTSLNRSNNVWKVCSLSWVVWKWYMKYKQLYRSDVGKQSMCALGFTLLLDKFQSWTMCHGEPAACRFSFQPHKLFLLISTSSSVKSPAELISWKNENLQTGIGQCAAMENKFVRRHSQGIIALQLWTPSVCYICKYSLLTPRY